MTKLQVYRADQMNVAPVDAAAFPPMANHRDFYLKSDVDALLATLQQPEPPCSESTEDRYRVILERIANEPMNAATMRQLAGATLRGISLGDWGVDEPPAGEPAHWSRMREICTCPKPGTSNSQIDPMCPLAFPHPWDRKHPNRPAGQEKS